jgi:hypothetical protein
MMDCKEFERSQFFLSGYYPEIRRDRLGKMSENFTLDFVTYLLHVLIQEIEPTIHDPTCSGLFNHY